MADNNSNRDLVLAPGEFAFVQDTTKGLVNTVVGPYKLSMSNTDKPVLWDKTHFVDAPNGRAIQTNIVAPEGYYVALFNPALSHPRDGSPQGAPEMRVGHRVHIPGPANFPLWAGQFAHVIRGHHLRSNQYLVAQVYNDAEAQANWQSAVVKPVGGEAKPETISSRDFTLGQMLIIKGTDVAFFIPPTGIKIVEDMHGNFVREAITLERLEYCILLDEDGNKRFVRGPDVVFPEPTETFVEKEGQRKFKAIDLNPTTGIYVKVIADYEEDGVRHKAGDELFITGKEQAIYFQREEHSVIRYGSGAEAQTKHYAVALPSGEGRYVLDRRVGKVSLERGPAMLLCDPRTQVIVRRVLAESTAKLWYPGNDKVVQVNRELAQQTAVADSTQYEVGRAAQAATYMSSTISNSAEMTARSRQIAGDTFVRGSAFTPPRTITLDTKYEGAVSVNVWTGYAVLIVNKTGDRRVVEGPNNVLLEYDETLAPLELSTGRPKTRDKLFRTVYLNVSNNVVSDVVEVETKDLVRANITLTYRVNFEGEDKVKWFAVENYVRLLCDHMRSLVRNTVKRKGIEEFYGNPIDIIRDAILGQPDAANKRKGRTFTENGMRVYDVEVLDVAITNQNVAGLLGTAQLTALKSALQIADEERQLVVTKRSDAIKRETAELRAATATFMQEKATEEIAAMLASNMAKLESEVKLAEATRDAELADQQKRHEMSREQIELDEAQAAAKAEIRQREVRIDMDRLKLETTEMVKRATAISPNLAVALTTFSDSALLERAATALGPLSAMSGVSAADVLAKLFKDTPLAAAMSALSARSRLPVVETFVEGSTK